MNTQNIAKRQVRETKKKQKRNTDIKQERRKKLKKEYSFQIHKPGHCQLRSTNVKYHSAMNNTKITPDPILAMLRFGTQTDLVRM